MKFTGNEELAARRRITRSLVIAGTLVGFLAVLEVLGTNLPTLLGS